MQFICEVMLWSYDLAFLFVHVDKAAGSSIQVALQPYAARQTKNRLRRRMTWLGPLNRWWGLYHSLDFPEHASARVAQRCLPPAVYENLFKFAFVRNPWDRLVSRYAYLLCNTDHHRHEWVKGLKDFDAYVNWEISRGKMFQYKYVVDEQERWLVNFIGYFERLEVDFACACARMKVRAELPHANRSAHRDYRSYYTPATRDRVANYFARDIEMFGYNFDGISSSREPATPKPLPV